MCTYVYVCPDLGQDGSGRKFLNGEAVQNHAFTHQLLIILGPFFVIWERGGPFAYLLMVHAKKKTCSAQVTHSSLGGSVSFAGVFI